MKKTALFLFCLLGVLSSYAQQQFEGRITYRWEIKNPMPEQIPDSAFYEGIKRELGGRTYIIGDYLYKNGHYKQVLDAGKQKGFQLFVPAEKKLYSWQQDSDTAIWISTSFNSPLEEVTDIIREKGTEEVLGIACQKITVKTKLGSTTYWYNPKVAPADANLFADHSYGHFNTYLKETGVLPLKFEQKGFMAWMVITATAMSAEPISDAEFKLPSFKALVENPMNELGN
jgi:hypothetical protein